VGNFSKGETKMKTRRTIKDIKRFISPKEIYQKIMTGPDWPYKTGMEYYRIRDCALCSLIYLTSGRINEVLRITKSQFNFKEEPEFIIIKDFYISKRKARIIKRGDKKIIVPPINPRIDMALPEYSKFTELALNHYNQVQTDLLFRFGRVRAWQLVRNKTGLWPHYFRSQKISYLVNKTKSALITARLVGIKSASTISHYYKTEWREHKEDLKI